MDKTPVEILAEVIGSSKDFIKRYADNKNANVPVPFALEAMKIAMKQAFDAGREKIPNPDWDYVYEDFDEYLKGLEEQK